MDSSVTLGTSVMPTSDYTQSSISNTHVILKPGRENSAVQRYLNHASPKQQNQLGHVFVLLFGEKAPQ